MCARLRAPSKDLKSQPAGPRHLAEGKTNGSNVVSVQGKGVKLGGEKRSGGSGRCARALPGGKQGTAVGRLPAEAPRVSGREPAPWGGAHRLRPAPPPCGFCALIGPLGHIRLGAGVRAGPAAVERPQSSRLGPGASEGGRPPARPPLTSPRFPQVPRAGSRALTSPATFQLRLCPLRPCCLAANPTAPRV